MRILFFLLLPIITFSQSLESLISKATTGDLDSQFNLAFKYYEANGVEQNYKQAFYWFEKAALQNDPTSQFNLGRMYDEGEGVKEDDNKAKEWYLRAIENDYCAAFNNLGMLYESGELGEKNINEAISWYNKGIDNNCDDCIYTLGTLYLYEETLANRKINALKWLEMAGNKGNKRAIKELTSIYYTPENYPEELKLEVDIQKAIHWNEKAALYNNKNAFRRLGMIYEYGYEYDESFPEDIEKANYFYKRAADLGDELSHYYIGLNTLLGIGLEKDINKGLEVINESAEKGEIEAQLKLGELYYIGETVSQDKKLAREWFNKVLEQKEKGNFAIDLAEYYTEINHPSLTFYFYLINAKEGNPVSQYNIGLMYKDGIGTIKNLSEAKSWFEKAYENGDNDAKRLLDELNN